MYGRYDIEVADFDFMSEEVEYKGIWEQIKDALIDSFAADIESTALTQGHRNVERPVVSCQ